MKQIIDLKGKRALVTGGGRGIGRSMALALADAGADVAIASRSLAELEAVAKEISDRGTRGLAVIIDVMNREQITAGVNEAARNLAGLDILINNAGGVIAEKPQFLNPIDHDPATFEDNLFLNLTQAFYATHAALPYMIRQKWGRIISIGSGYAKNGGGPLAYSAAKHGLIGMTRSLAYATAPYGINVNVLCPGWTNTRLVDWNMLLGAMAALLSSDASGAVTGQVISVDGGFMV
jgi:NAD(P)-dependent dehydrogenase (short-subunit alcohol dehydrogenase family)